MSEKCPREFREATSHNLSVPSAPAVAKSSPRSENAKASAPPPCATSEAVSFAFPASQNLSSPSCPQLAICLPSGDQATALTRPTCPTSVAWSFCARPWR